MKKLWIAPALLLAFIAPGVADEHEATEVVVTEPPSEGEPLLDAQAAEQIERMSRFLKGLKGFSFRVHVEFDEVEADGFKMRHTRQTRVEVQRPGSMFIMSKSEPDWHKNIVLHDRKLTITDQAEKVYSRVETPATIDASLDLLAEKYGIFAPAADLLYEDVQSVLMSDLEWLHYVGERHVRGVPCHQLAARHAFVDWQLWISKTDPPVPHRLIVTYREAPTQPQYDAFMTDWKPSVTFAKDHFSHAVPESFTMVPLMPREAMTEEVAEEITDEIDPSEGGDR